MSPTTAVVIPVRGHSALLAECLEALRVQTAPVDEVIVVDDSPDASLAPIEGVTVLRSGGLGPYGSRNLGWRSTSAEVVLFLDARSRPRPHWAQTLLAHFDDPRVAFAGSDIHVVGGHSWAARAASHRQVFAVESYTTRSFFKPYFPTCNLAVRRTALLAVDGFHEVRSGADADFCWRVQQDAAVQYGLTSEVLLDWVPRDDLRQYIEQFYRYGRSNVRLRSEWAGSGALPAETTPGIRLLVRSLRLTARLAAARIHGDDDTVLRHLSAASSLAYRIGLRVETDARSRAARRLLSAPEHPVVLTNLLTDHTNPWLGLWLAAERTVGLEVVQLTKEALLAHGRRAPAAVHLQWPEHSTLGRPLARPLKRSARLVAQVALARVRRLPVLLTVHNATSHAQDHPRLERWFWRALTALVTDVHALSAAGRPELEAAHPALARARWHVVAHGDYRPVTAPLLGSDDGRRSPGDADGSSVVLSFGSLRPYKGAGSLVEAFRAARFTDPVELVLAGATPGERELAELRQLVGDDERVQLRPGFLAHEELVATIRAADLVVLPYRRVLNSGSAFLALTCGRPVLAPRTPTFVELAGRVGAGWVSLYDGALTSEVLVEAVASARRPGGNPDLSWADWDVLTEQIGAMWREVLA